MTDLNQSLASKPATINDILPAISHNLDAATGLGMFLAKQPADAGWSQDSFWDHDIACTLQANAQGEAIYHLQSNNMFFRKALVEAACNQLLVEAFDEGFAGK